MFNFIIDCLIKVRMIRISNKLLLLGRNAYFGKNGYITGGKNIAIGSNFSIGDGYKLQTWNNLKRTSIDSLYISIGDDVSMMSNCQISSCNRVAIGNGCLLGDNVFITDNFHGKSTFSELNIPPVQRSLYTKGPVVIGNNVWIGRNACIMPGVSIGNGVVIGANSVVTHDIPANSIAVGSPAKVIKTIVH